MDTLAFVATLAVSRPRPLADRVESNAARAFSLA